MLRSEINACIEHAKELYASISFKLPEWGHYSPADWSNDPDLAKWCRDHQMGWDVTDYGEGNFEKRGLILFCLRNGICASRRSALCRKNHDCRRKSGMPVALPQGQNGRHHRARWR